MSERKILVTAALPYANGEIHIGHLLEYIQVDIWVRFQKMIGSKCYFVCADDAHGSAIMLKADELGVTPEHLIADVKTRHEADFKDFGIEFSHYHSTHSKENMTIASDIYQKLKQGGYITKRTISQAYDNKKKFFLPDRFIKGTCPKCGAKEQYGDNCESCGITYNYADLINPVSVLSGTKPIEKESEHYFFALPKFESRLKKWIKAGHLQKQVSNKLLEWFESGLMEWDISRDAPYFGFKIPDTNDKYFYVWLDAPIGYLASFKKLCELEDIDFDEFLQLESKTELYHFIGKDIMYFHTLFWPAMLMGSGYRTPSGVFAHGFLSVNGEKMSKSRGTFITARTYLKYLNPEYLRYYYAYKLSSGIDDIDLNLADFRQRFNVDIVGKVVNIASRCAVFMKKNFANKLAGEIDNNIYDEFTKKSELIAKYYETREYSKTMRIIIQLADKANRYIDTNKPWQMIKDNTMLDKTHTVVSTGLNLFKLLVIYLTPVIPKISELSAEFLNIKISWQDIKTPLLEHKIYNFSPLITRVEESSIDSILQDSML